MHLHFGSLFALVLEIWPPPGRPIMGARIETQQ